MPDSPSKYNNRVLTYSIFCNNQKLNETYILTYAYVRLELNHIGKATLKLDVGNMDKQTFVETDPDFFKPGNTIRIDTGDIKEEKTIFEGYIIDVSINIDKEGHSLMVIECRDYTYPATKSRKNRIFENKRDSELIKEILAPYGDIKVDTTNIQHSTMVQYYCTDWDFALSRADANGWFVFTNGKEISACSPKVNQSPVLTVTYGMDLINFDAGISCGEQFSSYEAVAWDPTQLKATKVQARSPILNNQGNLRPNEILNSESLLLQTDAPLTDRALQEWVNSMALKAGLARYQGTFSFYGSSEVLPGCIIELKGLGKRFNGNAFIGSVCHTIENNEWITKVGMGVSPTNKTDVVSSPVPEFIPGLEGLHTGIVKDVSNDPANEMRILIELPWMESNGTRLLWARMSTFFATNESGCFFLPEVGDEVVIGFINQDPCCPVVLGSMYGKKKKAPFEYDKRNNKKAFITRSKMSIEFDEEKKIITVKTPSNNTIELSDDAKSIKLTDQNRNEITMDNRGISLSSSKDIVLKAQGSIKVDAGMKAELNAKSDVDINGANVNASAKMSFKGKGNASAELSASGQTVIKGAIVMIN